MRTLSTRAILRAAWDSDESDEHVGPEAPRRTRPSAVGNAAGKPAGLWDSDDSDEEEEPEQAKKRSAALPESVSNCQTESESDWLPRGYDDEHNLIFTQQTDKANEQKKKTKNETKRKKNASF